MAKIEQLRPGYQGILEPEENQKNVALFCQGDVILVPGISFDANGRRLGSGLGFYDRFLANLNPEVLKIGVAWQSQISPTRLPEETHDVRMDCFCTETGFFRAKI